LLAVRDGNGLPIPNQQSQIQNRFLFQGREYSHVTGLYYFRLRWYDPATGRWLSKDPIGISGGLNLYAFCANDPVNYVDPSGTELLGAVLGGVGGFLVGGAVSALNGNGFWRGAIAGGVGGAVAGLTFNPVLGALAAEATVGTAVVAGAAAGAAGGLASGAVNEIWDSVDSDPTTAPSLRDLGRSAVGGAGAGALLGPLGATTSPNAWIYDLLMNANIAIYSDLGNKLGVGGECE
jgi:RHS repeat-associated protein